LRNIYVSHIDVSWVQCYKTDSRREILDRFVGHDVPNGSKASSKAKRLAARSVNYTNRALSSGISANILDFVLSAKAETGLKDRPQRSPGVNMNAAAQARDASIREKAYGSFV
jgi:hypothetical protein